MMFKFALLLLVNAADSQALQHTQHKDGDAMVHNSRNTSTSSYKAKLRKSKWANYATKAAAIGLPLRFVIDMVITIWEVLKRFGLAPDTPLSRYLELVNSKFLILFMIPLHVFGIRNGSTPQKVASWVALSFTLILALMGAEMLFFLVGEYIFSSAIFTDIQNAHSAIASYSRYVNIFVIRRLDLLINTAFYIMLIMIPLLPSEVM